VLPAVSLVACLLAGVLVPNLGSAQDLAPTALRRAVEASVLVSVEIPGVGTSEGSGSIIDSRGYVLTNFHVVGAIHPFEGSRPGVLYREDALVTLWTTTSARAEAMPTWRGRVVRGDPGTDLALIRIETDMDGTPVPSARRFPTVSFAAREPELGDTVFALGFPMGIRTVTLTRGQVSGFDVDADGAVAYQRVDADFNPGNSGGMLLSFEGALVGVPTLVSRSSRQASPIRRARPVTRIPNEWKEALARGDALEVQSPSRLELGDASISFRSSGAGFVVDGREMFFVEVPSGFDGSVRFAVDRTLELPIAADATLLSRGRPAVSIRTAVDNVLTISPRDGTDLVVAVVIERRRADGGQAGVSRLEATFSRNAAPQVVAGASNQESGIGGLGVRTTPTYVARPPQIDRDVFEIDSSWFHTEGGLVLDPTPQQDFVGGGFGGVALGVAIYSWTHEWPISGAFDMGIRVLSGMWREDAFVMASALVGGRVGFGSARLQVEIPVHYQLGIGSVEDNLSFSPYGYDVGVDVRWRNFAIGASWSEMQRGEFSVLRTLSLSTRWYL
jgi:Trypsin-like peptidase domain